MNVLHISFAKTWRGGERQLQLLTDGLSQLQVCNFFAYPQNSKAVEKIDKSQLVTLRSRYFFDPISLFNISQFIKNRKILILHCHCSKAHSLGLLLKLKFPELILIVHRRVAFQKSLQFLSKRKYLSPSVNQYIAISSEVKNRLLEAGVADSKIQVIASAVDTRLYKCKSPEGKSFVRAHFENYKNINPGCIYIGTASAFSKEKGLSDFIEALSLIAPKSDGPPIAVIMAGDGPLKSAIDKKILDKNFSFPIVTIGFCSQIPVLLAGLDIFVMPSHSEGLGSVAIEALASGCMVVSSDAGGLKEVIIDTENGLNYHFGDIKQLSHKLDLAINEESLRKKLSLNGIKYVEDHFSSVHMVRACFELYKKLCVSNV